MHVHNALHHFTRIQAAYRTAVQESDPGFSGIERAGETLTPVLDLWSLPEWRLLRGDVTYSLRATEVAAQAGLFSSFELVNPVGSGILAVVEAIRSDTANAINVVTDSGGALGAVGTERGIALDTRYAQLGQVSACTIVRGNLVGGAANLQDIIKANLESDQFYVLRPGTKLFLSTQAVNLALAAQFRWRERLATDDELGRFSL